MTLKNKNIIIVGMTGAGKTTIGKILSKELSRNFFDIDHEVEKVTMGGASDFSNFVEWKVICIKWLKICGVYTITFFASGKSPVMDLRESIPDHCFF